MLDDEKMRWIVTVGIISIPIDYEKVQKILEELLRMFGRKENDKPMNTG